MNCCSFISVAIASVMWFISFFFSFCFVFLLNGCEFLSNKTRGVSVFLVAAGRWRHFTSREKELKIKILKKAPDCTWSEKQGQICSDKRPRWIYHISFSSFYFAFFKIGATFPCSSDRLGSYADDCSYIKKKKMNNLFEDQQQHLGITSFLHIPHAVNAWCDVGNPSFTLQTNMTLIAGAPESGYCTFQLTV